MKILTILILIVNISFAQTTIYDLISDGKQIGTLSVKIQNLENNHQRYITYLKLKISFMFGDYSYEYRENALFHKGNLLEFTVSQNDDGNYKRMTANVQDKKIVFANGRKIKLSQINMTPFDINDAFNKNDSDLKKFTLRTFDGLTGELVDEVYKVMDNKIYHVLEKRNTLNDEIEIITISKDGELIKLVGKDYEMTLQTKGK